MEIDLVPHVGSVIGGQLGQVRDDIARVADIVHAASAAHLIKVILETAALSEEQIASGCRCCAEAQVDYVKTSTGFHPAGGATPEAVRMVKRVPPGVKTFTLTIQATQNASASSIRRIIQIRPKLKVGGASLEIPTLRFALKIARQ